MRCPSGEHLLMYVLDTNVVSDPRAERDALIAATAREHGMTMVTRNTSDIEKTGVALLDP